MPAPQAQDTKQEGMGSILHDNGVAFRVWAPHADRVFIAGTFNDWANDKDEMAAEPNGHWYANLSHAKVGDEYRYVIFNGDQELWRNDPYARQLTGSDGNTVIYDANFEWTDAEFKTAERNELVIYELHIGTFRAEKEDVPSTFDEVRENLDYLKKLGINCIELLPVNEFEGAISWGYNMGHLFAVESAYGGPDALKRFINDAHNLGITVLLDIVHNHVGPNHVDIWRFDGWYEGDHGGIYFFQDERSYTPWGDRPDFGREEVRRYLLDNYLVWIDEFHFDGFRVDSTVNIYAMQNPRWERIGEIPEGFTFLQWVNTELCKKKPDVLLIAEDLQDDPIVTRTVSEGGLGYHSQWYQAFHDKLRDVLIATVDDERDLNMIAEILTQSYNGDPLEHTIYLETHDEAGGDEPDKLRIPRLIDPGNPLGRYAKKRAALGAGILLTTPAIPLMFQGQEFMYIETFKPGTVIDWSHLDEMRGIHRLYRDLIRFRRNVRGLTRGLRGPGINVFHMNHEAKVIAYHRYDQGGPGDDVVVVINFRDQIFSNYTIGFPSAGNWRLRFNSDFEGYNEDFGDYQSFDTTAEEGETDGVAAHGLINIAPYSMLIFSQDPE